MKKINIQIINIVLMKNPQNQKKLIKMEIKIQIVKKKNRFAMILKLILIVKTQFKKKTI